jgi:hypothetical protein
MPRRAQARAAVTSSKHRYRVRRCAPVTTLAILSL